MLKLAFPKDIPYASQIAYAQAMSVVLNTHPDVHTTHEAIAAVAQANFAVCSSELIRTNDTRTFADLYRGCFFFGYKDACDFFQAKPDEYKKWMSLTEDEQIAACMVMGEKWFQFMQDEAIPEMIGKIKYKLATRR